ncbi:SETMAR [Cordylochernes scorpioides]|uniref:SETMAR n=1 Tax=Cordylochernes scorpioides TaxID=51811 RepID=A0ABY6KV52_9ARAC|nr:SETMAR [Cordylochernes scorpioides]
MKNEEEESVLHKACLNQNRKIAAFLIKVGANVNEKTNKGISVLEYSFLKSNSNELTKLLIQSGAILDAGISYKALHIAARYLKSNILQTLLEGEAEIKLENENGKTAFDIVVIECINSRKSYFYKMDSLKLILKYSEHIDLNNFLMNHPNDIDILTQQFICLIIKYSILLDPKTSLSSDIQMSTEMSDWVNNCKTQVLKMQSHFIGKTNTTLYSFITEKNLNKVAGFLSNDSTGLRQELELNMPLFAELYPSYHDILEECFMEESRGRPFVVDNDQLKAIIEADTHKITREVAKELNVDQSTIVRHLTQIGKVKKLDKWVPHDLNDVHENRRFEVSWGVVSGNDTLDPPSYSPDILAYRLPLFKHLTTFLGEKRFKNHGDAKTPFNEFIASRTPDFYKTRIYQLVSRWKRYVDANGADCNLPDQWGRTPLMNDSKICDANFFNYLLKLKLDLEARCQNQLTAIFNSIKLRKFLNFKLLIEAGADIGKKEVLDRTLLHYACLFEFREVASLLIKSGADVNKKCILGDAPLAMTIENKSDELAKLLIQAGASINAKNENNETALHKTSCTLNPVIIHTLLDAGADANIKNKSRKLPLNRPAIEIILLKDAFYISENLVTKRLLRKCGFKHTESVEQSSESLKIANSDSGWGRLTNYGDLTFENYSHVNEDISVHGSLTDANILNSTHLVQDEKEDLPPISITLNKAKRSLTTLRTFFEDPPSASSPTEPWLEDFKRAMASLKPATSRPHGNRHVYVPKPLETCSHVYLRRDLILPPLAPPYDGPYEVLFRKPKIYKLKIKKISTWVSIDRLKPAFTSEGPKFSQDPNLASQ